MNYSPKPPSITLINQSGEFPNQQFTAAGNVMIIGRQPGCQITINHTKISRDHARITLAADSVWYIEDLNSSNGTFVNGNRINGSHPLRSGDHLRFGPVAFLFQSTISNSGGGNDATITDDADPDATMLEAGVGFNPPARQPQETPFPFPQPPQQSVQQFQPPPIPYTPPTAPPPVQPSAYTPMPNIPPKKKKRRPCLVIILIILLLTCLVTTVVGVLFFDDIMWEIDNFFNPYVVVPNTNTNQNSNSNQNTNTNTNTTPNVTGANSLTVSTNEGGFVTSDSGATVSIPPGAVPPTENGEPGKMTFSIREDTNRTVALPEGFSGVGPVYELGPEGFTFNTPVELTLPIPVDIDPATVLGLTFYDEFTGEWKMVPAAIDAENKIASVSTVHFSYWGMFTRADYEHSNWRSTNGGNIRIINNHHYDSGTYPPEGGSKPYSATYGVCIQSYNLDDPSHRWSWTEPYQWTMTVSDYSHPGSTYNFSTRKHDWWLPNGAYQLIEVWHFSEVNHTVLDTPAYSNYWRPYGTININGGDVKEFPYNENDIDFNTMTPGRAPCFGVEDTSVGTGDVQITLTWSASVDLDLYVEDPTGEVVSYSYTPIPSGGQLDRDNECSDLVIGRPENIFWPEGSAPSGTYKISVNYFGGCESYDAVSYTVRTVIQGVTNTYEGTISSDEYTDEVTTFNVP